jgi:hypothetical protein
MFQSHKWTFFFSDVPSHKQIMLVILISSYDLFSVFFSAVLLPLVIHGSMVVMSIYFFGSKILWCFMHYPSFEGLHSFTYNLIIHVLTLAGCSGRSMGKGLIS